MNLWKNKLTHNGRRSVNEPKKMANIDSNGWISFSLDLENKYNNFTTLIVHTILLYKTQAQMNNEMKMWLKLEF
jgi:hypothetical protein